jgi:hypothetical protein
VLIMIVGLQNSLEGLEDGRQTTVAQAFSAAAVLTKA